MTNAKTTSAVPPITRSLLGLAGAGLVMAGLYMAFWGGEPVTGGALVRVGLVLGAAWLVAPLVRRPSLATVGFLLAGAAVFVRPRLVVAVAVAAVMWRLARRRS